VQVDLNPGQLDALVAIADHGSFDAAARQLHITPSAVSQRIRALEATAGQVLISRAAPCRPTPHGASLVRLGRQTRLLYAEASQAITAATAVDLPVAVNADSLAVWFHDVLAEVAAWDGTAIKLRVEDQAYSQELLRRGDVLAAVTSDPAAVQGCSVHPLGALRYLPAAAPAVADRWQLKGEGPGGTGGGSPPCLEAVPPGGDCPAPNRQRRCGQSSSTISSGAVPRCCCPRPATRSALLATASGTDDGDSHRTSVSMSARMAGSLADIVATSVERSTAQTFGVARTPKCRYFSPVGSA
jgi:molybdenum-dependent DNA-binding transcriptional regulator ModE